jgi:GxxExxY protein
MDEVEQLARVAIDCGMRLHKRLGPGLLESAYEIILCEQLQREGLRVERQKAVSIDVDGIRIADAFRVDLLLNGTLVLEIKSVDRLAPVHSKQLLTYLKLLDLRLGLLMNFGQETLRDGLRRIVNGPSSFVPSRLRANVQSHAQETSQ